MPNTRCAMGMPGSETALEKLMCLVLGDCLQDGIAAKLANDTPEELLQNWQRVLDALQRCNLHLSASKTTICPQSTTILGWVWTQGQLSASQHRVAIHIHTTNVLLLLLLSANASLNCYLYLITTRIYLVLLQLENGIQSWFK